MEEKKAKRLFSCEGGSPSSAGGQEAPGPSSDPRSVRPTLTARAPGCGHGRTLSVSREQLVSNPSAPVHAIPVEPSEERSEEELSEEDAAAAPSDDLCILDRLEVNSRVMTEEEMQNAFVQLAMAFRCDQHTLCRRLQAQERARDLTEKNVHKELEQGRDALQMLKALCLDSKRAQILQRLEVCLKILASIIGRISNTAEVLGAVHQEARVNRAVELMLAHVENVQRRHVRDLAELEEAKRLAQRSSCSRQLSDPRDEGEMRQKLIKPAQLGSRRRVSIAIIPSSQVGARSLGVGGPLEMCDDGLWLCTSNKTGRQRAFGWRSQKTVLLPSCPTHLQSEEPRSVRGPRAAGGAGAGQQDGRPLETPTKVMAEGGLLAAPPPATQGTEDDARALTCHSASQETMCGRLWSRRQKKEALMGGCGVSVIGEPDPSCDEEEETHPHLCSVTHKQRPLVPRWSNCRWILLGLYVGALSCMVLLGVFLWCVQGPFLWI